MQISHATARANAGAWWPCWPSMVGHGLRRPAACLRVRRREIRVSLAGFHTGRDGAARQEPWLGLGQALTPNQIRDAVARANAGAWLGPGTHPSGLGVPNTHNGPCPKPAACPTPRRTAGLAPSHHLRSVRNATRRPGVVGQCGAVLWRTRAVSACPTRATRPALSRQRALCSGAQQGRLDLTACDPYGARRGSRAVRGSAELSCGVPGQSRRAQRAHELCRLHKCPGLRRHPWHSSTSLLGPTNERHDDPSSMELVRHREGAQRRPRALGRHDEPQRPEPPPASASCWYV